MSEIHGWTHAPNGADALEGAYEIEVFLDPNHPVAVLNPAVSEVVVGDQIWRWPVPRDVAGSYLREAEAGVCEVGDVEIQLVHLPRVGADVDMLSTPITIDSGERTSYFCTPSVIDVENSQVHLGDWIGISVLSVGGDPLGLRVIVNFGPRLSV